MRLDSNLLAHIQHRAGRAFWERACANMFAKRNEQAIDVNPMFARKIGFKG